MFVQVHGYHRTGVGCMSHLLDIVVMVYQEITEEAENRYESYQKYHSGRFKDRPY